MANDDFITWEDEFESLWDDITEEVIIDIPEKCSYKEPRQIPEVKPRLFFPENYSAGVQVQLATMCSKLESEAKRKVRETPVCNVTGERVHIRAMRRNKHGAYVLAFFVCPECYGGVP